MSTITCKWMWNKCLASVTHMSMINDVLKYAPEMKNPYPHVNNYSCCYPQCDILWPGIVNFNRFWPIWCDCFEKLQIIWHSDVFVWATNRWSLYQTGHKWKLHFYSDKAYNLFEKQIQQKTTTKTTTKNNNNHESKHENSSVHPYLYAD